MAANVKGLFKTHNVPVMYAWFAYIILSTLLSAYNLATSLPFLAPLPPR
ncbi:hypothetical protein JGH11_04795 [Dysgonomonas sp. Marseille-P4677]|nr:hypothetical protein [Dysgonomonas sp. Marseille-P4677]MBK5720184.1 hypothetical protein [Dysgonomonas sp. Marseille-P4677]